MTNKQEVMRSPFYTARHLAHICLGQRGRAICFEGIVYSEDLTKEELNQIGTFVLGALSEVEVKQFPPQVRLQVHRSFPEFMLKVFWPAGLAHVAITKALAHFTVNQGSQIGVEQGLSPANCNSPTL